VGSVHTATVLERHATTHVATRHHHADGTEHAHDDAAARTRGHIHHGPHGDSGPVTWSHGDRPTYDLCLECGHEITLDGNTGRWTDLLADVDGGTGDQCTVSGAAHRPAAGHGTLGRLG
jgi:hypothetical protein